MQDLQVCPAPPYCGHQNSNRADCRHAMPPRDARRSHQNGPPRTQRRAAASIKVTVADVARRAGVSVGTVSNVLNGREFGLRDARKEVLSAIRDLGFTQNLLAKGMRLQRSQRRRAVHALFELFELFRAGGFDRAVPVGQQLSADAGAQPAGPRRRSSRASSAWSPTRSAGCCWCRASSRRRSSTFCISAACRRCWSTGRWRRTGASTRSRSTTAP